MKHRLLALAAAGALCLSLCGFSGEQPLPDTITVQGTGLVEARPDQTEFSAGVRVTSPTAAAAVAAGSEQAAAVRQALESAGVPTENITTEAVWLRAQYTYTNAARIRDGFEYRMEFSVQVPEGVEAGAALDAAIAGGANSTGSLQQTMADADALYNEALGAAVESARQSAEQLAVASGKKLGKAILITEESDGVAAESDRNNPDTGGGAELMGAVEQDTAILAGTRAIQARVRVVFELV